MLGAEVSGPKPERTAAPNGQTFKWEDVSFRLTLGWKVLTDGTEEDAPRSDAASAPASAGLIICSFEITSSPAKTIRNDPFDPVNPDYAFTIYFSDLV